MAKLSNSTDFTLAEIEPRELRALLASSDEMFIEYFLGDQIADTDSVQDFHLITFGRFTDMDTALDVAALPRDHAKTTYARLACMKIMVFTRVQFFVSMGATHSGAAASVSVIRNYLLSDEWTLAFGVPEFTIDRPSEGHVEAYIDYFDAEGEAHRKLVIIRALGVGQALRGMNRYGLRPQYVICDDIEDETAVKTEEGYLKLKTWFDNTFMRAVSREPGLHKVCQIGNLIGLQTLLNDNLNDPDWRAMRLGILRRNGLPLWPSRFPIEAIRKDFERAKRRGQLSAWFGELMNMPLNLETALVDIDKITLSPRRHPSDGVKYRTFITIDPAISQKQHADDAAIVLHTIDPGGLPQVTEYIYGKMGVEGIADAVKTLCRKWDCHVVGCESVQLQAVLLNYLEISFRMDHMVDYEFVPIEVGKTHKLARLRTWCALLLDGEYSLAEGDWDVIAQLMQYDIRTDNNKDDLIDSCAMGQNMLRNYLDLIFAEREGSIAQKPPAAVNGTTAY